MLVLSDQRAATLRAAVNRIIPADDFCPGGVEAGAYDFLVRHLTPGGYFPHLLTEYQDNLDTLEAVSRQMFSTPLPDLTDEQQDFVLIQFERDHNAFFRLFVEQTQEGFYTSPSAYTMIGWRVTG